VSHADTDPVRVALAEMLGEFAGRIDAWLLAEGIETPAELAAFAQLGVPLAQGWLLGRAVRERIVSICAVGGWRPENRVPGLRRARPPSSSGLGRVGPTVRQQVFWGPLGGQTPGGHGTVPGVRLPRTPDAPVPSAPRARMPGGPHRGMEPAACRALAPATAHTRGTS
jgi:EAL domain-containing protein (putative c-di-GMP-specific phosphodiesterase class I)